ncbi:MAG TPA: serine hydrolase [Gemmatimonadales bacterium]|nr:serine hydrolase [Gemmatimonadales bacterium]
MKLLVVATTTLLAAPLAAQSTSFRIADSLVESGIRRGIYPGAVLVVGNRAGTMHARGFGHLTWARSSPLPNPDSTLWDLASLTKVVATTPAVMRLVDQGRVDLKEPISHYLPRFIGGGKEQVTVRQLLDHTSGLPAYVEFFHLAPTRDSMITLLYRTPLRRPPGTAVEYSDLNFLLLGLLVESLSSEPLDRFVIQEVLEPAGMLRSRYRPGDSLSRYTAPTGQWRGRPVCCQVNDQNAARMGGAAGHAGLFSTGGDLARYARLWLSEGTLDGQRVFQSATGRAFVSPDSGAATRLLGWERPPDPKHRDDSAYGHLLSDHAFGHTGWTGTLIWIDPERDLFLVLLTNRSYAPRVSHSFRALRAVRGAVADAVIREVEGH